MTTDTSYDKSYLNRALLERGKRKHRRGSIAAHRPESGRVRARVDGTEEVEWLETEDVDTV